MTEKRSPLFLERRSYRRRRMMDFVRILPVLGTFFFMFPMLWTLGDGAGPRTTSGVIYVFLIWIGFIFLSAGISFWLSISDKETDDGDTL